jgi:TolA protein
MSRLQKKCLIASAGAHGLLAGILIVGVAFVGRHKEDEEVPPMMTLIPSRLVDALGSGGGNPDVTTPPAPAPQVLPAPAPEIPKPEVAPTVKPPEPSQPEPKKIDHVNSDRKPEAEPALKPEVHKAPKKKVSEPDYEEIIASLKDVDQMSLKEKPQKPGKPKKDAKSPAATATHEPKRHEIVVNLKSVKTTGPSAAEVARAARQRAEAVAKQQAALDAYRQALEQRSSALSSVLNRLDKGLSTGTAIVVPGPGGEAFANYGLYVRSMYDSAWSAPQDAPEDSAKVQIKVVIGRDGSIISSEITRKSGNPALDKSVQRALNAVRQFPPFPAESTDRERVFFINFDLKAKRQIG